MNKKLPNEKRGPSYTTSSGRVKTSVNFDPVAWEWLNNRKDAFGNKASRYLDYLILQERDRLMRGKDSFYHFVQRVESKLQELVGIENIETPQSGIDFVIGKIGIEVKTKFTPGDSLSRMIAHVSSAFYKYGLEKIILVLPSDASDNDILNFQVLQGSGAFESFQVIRFEDLKNIESTLLAEVHNNGAGNNGSKKPA